MGGDQDTRQPIMKVCGAFTHHKHDGDTACVNGTSPPCPYPHVDLTEAEHRAREAQIAGVTKHRAKADAERAKGKGGKKGPGRGKAKAVVANNECSYDNDYVGGNTLGASDSGTYRVPAPAPAPAVPQPVQGPPAPLDGFEYQSGQRKINAQKWRRWNLQQ